jgi:hypothetical protein
MFDKSIGMYVYEYTFLDDLSFIQPCENNSEINGFTIIEIFKKHGWEGDGEIGIIWLPPFLTDDGSTDGTYLWHVKQRNNGISYIISPCSIPIGYLGSNNSSGQTFSSISENTKINLKKLKNWQNEIISQQRYLDSIPDHPEKNKLIQRALISMHDNIISEFKVWIDSYYLDMLQEKYIYKNSKIKINLSKVKISANVVSQQDWEGLTEHHKNWLTQANFTSDAWNSFIEYSMNEKVKCLYSAAGFNPDKSIDNKIRTHIEIRNCIHHENGVVSGKLLKRMGGLKNLKLSSGEIYTKGDKLEISAATIISLLDALEGFVTSYRVFMRDFFFIKKSI